MSKKIKKSSETEHYSKDITEHQRIDLIDYLTGILNLQFEVLHVNEARANTVIAINAGLIAAIIWVSQSCSTTNNVSVILILMAILLNIGSLFMGLLFAVPRINSRIGNEDNVRGTIGICRLSKEMYYEKVVNLNHDKMVEQLSFQISGMARNNKRGAKYLVLAIILLMISIILFIASVFIWLINYVE